MRISLPSRYFLFFIVVSIFGGLTAPSFAAELTLSSLTHIEGLTFQTSLKKSPLHQEVALQALTFTTHETTTITLIEDESNLQTVAPADIEIATTIENPTPTVTPTLTPSEATKLIAGATITVTPSLSPSPTQTTIPLPSPTTVATPTPQPVVVAPADLEAVFTQYADQYHVDKEQLKKIAKCESSFNSGATYMDYGGMFQFAPSSWSSTRSAMGLDPNPDLRFNGEESIKTAAFKISRDGPSAWPSCH